MAFAAAFAAAALPAHAAGTHAKLQHGFQLADGTVPSAVLTPDGHGSYYGVTQWGGANGKGTLYKFTPPHGFVKLYDFANGAANPDSGVALAPGGGLIGTGLRADGQPGSVIYKVSQAGHETVLHTFDTNSRFGYGFWGPLLVDAQGTITGATRQGGKALCGVAFRLSASGRMEKLHAFGGAADGCQPMGGLIGDADGNLYGVTLHGGLNDGGTVFKLDSRGRETVLYRFDGSFGARDGKNPISPLLRGADGSLTGTTISGDEKSAANGTVFRLSADGHETILHRFHAARDGAYPMGQLARDAQGDIYGTTQLGGFGIGTVYRISPDGKERVIHALHGNEGATPQGGVVLDADGNLFATATGGGGGDVRGTIFTLEMGFTLETGFTPATGAAQ